MEAGRVRARRRIAGPNLLRVAPPRRSCLAASGPGADHERSLLRDETSPEGGSRMNQVFRTSEARKGRDGSAGPGARLFVGLAAALAMMGAAGCGGDEMLEDEPIDSVSQELGDKGWNGIPPHV